MKKNGPIMKACDFFKLDFSKLGENVEAFGLPYHHVPVPAGARSKLTVATPAVASVTPVA